MLFSSVEFLYYFLPITLLLYYIVPFRFKNSVLLVMSLLFYFYGGTTQIAIMLATITVSYIAARLMEYFRGRKTEKYIFWCSVILTIGLLGYYKYIDFMIRNINTALGLDIPLVGVALPIGISFYTFQALSYMIDVYRKKIPVQKSFLKLATYVSLFPQLIAGPIVRYDTISAELSERKHSISEFSNGVVRFVIGLSKKVLIANLLGELCDIFRYTEEKTLLFYWMYAVAFSLSIYFDFSGYSDMAIGLGRMFGFHFLENFNYPFVAKSISEFWRRWHISLGTWFREYVYIPLGGNHVSKPRWIWNIFIVWFLTGFWHGSEWNFVIWGLYFGILLMVEKLFLGKMLEKLPAFLQHFYVLLLVVISFVIFNADNVVEMVGDVAGLFGIGVSGFSDAITLYYLRSYAVVFLVAIIFSTPIANWFRKKLDANKKVSVVMDCCTPVFVVVALLISTAYLVDGSFNPFLYFRF